jgi:hypothetical protein
MSTGSFGQQDSSLKFEGNTTKLHSSSIRTHLRSDELQKKGIELLYKSCVIIMGTYNLVYQCSFHFPIFTKS